MEAADTQIGGTHYTSKNVQPWHAMEAWMTRDQFAVFLRGNAIKLRQLGAKPERRTKCLDKPPGAALCDRSA